jgi:hypothetical protein
MVYQQCHLPVYPAALVGVCRVTRIVVSSSQQCYFAGQTKSVIVVVNRLLGNAQGRSNPTLQTTSGFHWWCHVGVFEDSGENHRANSCQQMCPFSEKYPIQPVTSQIDN